MKQRDLKSELSTLHSLIEEEQDPTVIELLSCFCRVNLVERKLEALEHLYTNSRVKIEEEKVLIR